MNNKCIQIVNINDDINLSSASQIIEHFNVNDYNLYGFSTSPDSTTPEYVAGSIESFTSDIDLYCIWTRYNVYYVTFMSNNGTGENYIQPFEEDVTKQLKKNNFSYDGYKFLGWSTASDGSVEYDDEQEISITQDLILYAIWEQQSDVPDVEINETIPGETNPNFNDIQAWNDGYDLWWQHTT